MTTELNYKAICERVKKSAVKGNAVKLLAVSKTQTTDKIAELYKLGQRDFGENYVQELTQKAEELSRQGLSDIRWHFIGHLQRNKIKQVLPWVHEIQTIDRLELAEGISKHLNKNSLRVFIQVNIDNEASKSGVLPAETKKLAEAVSGLPGIDLRGLMAIPDPESHDVENAFKRLRDLELTCRPYTHGELSMGMSHDFEQAIRCGATVVRVGTALFGERK